MPFSFGYTDGETQLRQSVRIEVAEEHRQQKNLHYIVHEVLLGFLKINRADILSLFDQESRGQYTVTFLTPASCTNIYADLSGASQSETCLDGLNFSFLYGGEDIPLVICTYSPFVSGGDIETFLARYCREVRLSHKIKNGEGFWNWKRKYWVKLRQDPGGIGGFMHPPSQFALGRIRGYLVYPQMPTYCRRCKRYGHTQEECRSEPEVICNRCGQRGHVANKCKNSVRCNLCGEEGHDFKKCPLRATKDESRSRSPKPGPEQQAATCAAADGNAQRPESADTGSRPMPSTAASGGPPLPAPEGGRRDSTGAEQSKKGKCSAKTPQEARRKSTSNLAQEPSVPPAEILKADDGQPVQGLRRKLSLGSTRSSLSSSEDSETKTPRTRSQVARSEPCPDAPPIQDKAKKTSSASSARIDKGSTASGFTAPLAVEPLKKNAGTGRRRSTGKPEQISPDTLVGDVAKMASQEKGKGQRASQAPVQQPETSKDPETPMTRPGVELTRDDCSTTSQGPEISSRGDDEEDMDRSQSAKRSREEEESGIQRRSRVRATSVTSSDPINILDPTSPDPGDEDTPLISEVSSGMDSESP